MGKVSGWELVPVKRNPRTEVAQTMNIFGNHGKAYLTVTFVVSRTSCFEYFWRVRSEENYDFLSFFVNKVKRSIISGNMKKWQSRVAQLSRGRNTLSWVYQKDSGTSRGGDKKDSGDSRNADRAWVGSMKLIPGKCSIPDCFKKGWKYRAVAYSKVSNVLSAKVCQVLCQKNKKCQVFTYLANKDCYIIFVHGGLDSTNLKGATSGRRYCDSSGGKPSGGKPSGGKQPSGKQLSAIVHRC